MRTIITLCLLAMVPALSFAQKTVSAESIINSINSNTPVAIADATITGDLDLTNLANKKLESQNSHDKKYISTVEVPVNFTNCTFTGKVLGYYNPAFDHPGLKQPPVYNANFDEDVHFENCIFQKDVSFKYSQFNKTVSFTNSRFNQDAEFKYTDFEKGPVFQAVTFNDAAIFKYVNFPAGFDFSHAVFESIADFKYAAFKEAGSFTSTLFKGGADFKYAGFVSAVDFKGASFNGATDFKYTTLDDHQTTASELVSK